MKPRLRVTGNTFRAAIAAAALLWASVGPAADDAGTAGSSESAQERVEAFVNEFETFEADFTQLLADGAGTTIDRASGHLIVAKPWRFRWDYDPPGGQLLVADGDEVWLYDRDLEQVTVRPIDATLEGTPAMLLSGEGALSDEFLARRIDERAGTTWIALEPARAESDFREVRLGLEGDVLRYMELDDKLGQTTQLEFTNVELNKPVDPLLFEFVPPPDADVIGASETATPD